MNMGEYLQAMEIYMRLALKAQAQCTRTIEVLAAMKNPPIVYARQTNIAHGPQQVNNGVSTHAGKTENQQTRLLTKDTHAEMDTSRTSASIGADQELETVGEVLRRENTRG